MRILVISAHPDDEVLGVGGTIKKYSKLGYDIKIIFMATGLFARRSTNFKNSTTYQVSKSSTSKINKQLTTLQNHAKKAAKILGVKNVEFFNFPDNEMDSVTNLEITKTIETVLDSFSPQIVFTHSKTDLNVDHRRIYDATLTATRTLPTNSIKEVLTYEVPSSTEWNFDSAFMPNVFVDISKELDFKLKALSCYKTEIKSFPHPRSTKGLKINSQRWGTVCGFKAAEAFSLIRQLR